MSARTFMPFVVYASAGTPGSTFAALVPFGPHGSYVPKPLVAIGESRRA